MKKMLMLITLVLFLIPGIAYGRTAQANMNDAMARAYKAATEKNVDEAKDWLRKAAGYAKEAKNWQGLLDAGYGLSTLGLPEEAAECFDGAGELIVQAKDWHGGVALGYGYASLPDKLNLLDKASSIWTNSKAWAKDKENLYGLIEVGRGFMSIGKNSEAEECFDLAKKLLKEAPTEKGVKTLVQAYRKLGKEDKAAECAQYTPASPSQLPPGWKPTAGETVRKPKTVSLAAQQAQRSSADRDIQAREQWEREQAQREQQKQLQRQQQAYAAYRDYLRYYSYPYYGVYSGVIANYDDYYIYSWCSRPVWCARTYPEIYNWGLWNLGRYTCVDGFYISIDID